MPRVAREARIKGIAVARAHVIRADGTEQIYYSTPQLPLWDLRRRWKLYKHVQMMRNEDKESTHA